MPIAFRSIQAGTVNRGRQQRDTSIYMSIHMEHDATMDSPGSPEKRGLIMPPGSPDSWLLLGARSPAHSLTKISMFTPSLHKLGGMSPGEECWKNVSELQSL